MPGTQSRHTRAHLPVQKHATQITTLHSRSIAYILCAVLTRQMAMWQPRLSQVSSRSQRHLRQQHKVPFPWTVPLTRPQPTGVDTRSDNVDAAVPRNAVNHERQALEAAAAAATAAAC
jgi:hypothetical protein